MPDLPKINLNKLIEQSSKADGPIYNRPFDDEDINLEKLAIEKNLELIRKAVTEHAEWAAQECAGILWFSIDNISFYEEGKKVDARWMAKIVLNTDEGSGIQSTSIPAHVSYEECIVELERTDNIDENVLYYVKNWDCDPSKAIYKELSWDDDKVTQDDVDLFCQWQDEASLFNELIKRFGEASRVDLTLFPSKLWPLITKSLNQVND